MADIGIIKFQLEQMNFCMYADPILEIVRYTGVRRIPNPLPYVVGIIELRHHIVTVVDLHKRIGLPPLSLTRNAVMIVATLSSGTYGILVDMISDFRRIPEEQILPPISIAGLPEHLLQGVLKEADDILPIPNFDRIFSSYFRIHLVPITPSEKLAFQYRFTPGALSRTLEKNLLMHSVPQQKLDNQLIRKLPRSLYLPSVKVHRMISYYKDFEPQQPKQEHTASPGQTYRSRSGDEHYAVLSNRFDTQERNRNVYHGRTASSLSDGFEESTELLSYHSEEPGPVQLEHVLHHVPRVVSLSENSRSRTVRLKPVLGKHLATTLHSPSVKVAKYFSYHASAKNDTGAPSSSKSPEYFEHQLKLMVQDDQPLDDSEDQRRTLWNTLDYLHRQHTRLTPELIRGLCVKFHVSPVKLAKILSFFPEYALALEHNPNDATSETPSQCHELQETSQSSPTVSEMTFACDSEETSINDCLWQLADQHALFDAQAIRYAASHMRVSTCRLSKLQTYYRWNHEDTN